MTKIRIKNPVYGVPITFLGVYNPEQFGILGLAAGNTNKTFPELERLCGHISNVSGDKGGCPMLKNNPTYARILIRKKR